jgi:hypothetical protein
MLVPLLAPSRRVPQCLKRTIFTLPDLSSLAANVTGSDNDKMTYSERKILPYAVYFVKHNVLLTSMQIHSEAAL